MNYYVKHARTYHLPFSEKATDDDKRLSDCSQFEDQDIVVTVKLDGQNTSIYSDYVHARSVNGSNHPSMNWVKGYAASFQYQIPSNWRVCGEDISIVHTIRYKAANRFYVHSVWDETNTCLSWEDTRLICDELGLDLVPVLYEGEWNQKIVESLYTTEYDGNVMEGYVVRNISSFGYNEFADNVAKFVSNSFQIGNQHWNKGVLEMNDLIERI